MTEKQLNVVNHLFNIFANEISDEPSSEVIADIKKAIPKARALLNELEETVGVHRDPIPLKSLAKLIREYDGEDKEHLADGETLVLHTSKGYQLRLTLKVVK